MDVREKLVELLREVQYLGGLEEKIADHLIAHGVTVQQWVPVSVRLPEEHGEYIVVIKGTNRATTLLYLPIGGTGRCPGSLAPYPVTHWMPLPEPPKENE